MTVRRLRGQTSVLRAPTSPKREIGRLHGGCDIGHGGIGGNEDVCGAAVWDQVDNRCLLTHNPALLYF